MSQSYVVYILELLLMREKRIIQIIYTIQLNVIQTERPHRATNKKGFLLDRSYKKYKNGKESVMQGI